MAKTSNCELVRKGELKRIPKDWNDRGMPTCRGYVDAMTDAAYDECLQCKWFEGNLKYDFEEG